MSNKNLSVTAIVCVLLVSTMFGIMSVKIAKATTSTETLWVSSYNSGETGWGKVGSSPYLDSGESSYIYITSWSTPGAADGAYRFANAQEGTGAIVDVTLSLLCNATPVEAGECEFYPSIYNGHFTANETVTGSYVDLAYTVPSSGTPTWYYYNVTSTITTWEKVDAASVKVTLSLRVGVATTYIYDAKLVVTYTPTSTPSAEIGVIGTETDPGYAHVDDIVNQLENCYGYSVELIHPASENITQGFLAKFDALMIFTGSSNPLPGTNSMWGALLVQRYSETHPTLAHSYTFASQIYRTNSTTAPVSYTSITTGYGIEPFGYEQRYQNITFSATYGYFSSGDIVPFNGDDGTIKVINSSQAGWGTIGGTLAIVANWTMNAECCAIGKWQLGYEYIYYMDLTAFGGGAQINDRYTKNFVLYPWLDIVDTEIGNDKCSYSRWIKKWYGNGISCWNWSQITSEIDSIVALNSTLISKVSLGTSVNGTDIWSIQIGNGNSIALLVGGIHGDEKWTVAEMLNTARWIYNAYHYSDTYWSEGNWKNLLSGHRRNPRKD